jgi:malto-oligosyltrehalose synthase
MSATLSDTAMLRVARRPRIVPRATYRVQLHAGFTFADAAAIVPYLERLGVSHLYLSPILKARAGSLHGYDVVDHSQVNPELGGADGLERLAATARAHRMGLIVDVVPNHMAIFAADNQWWLDVLENGPSGRYAGYFDIDWRPFRASMRDRLLVPVLGDAFGALLERGELKAGFDPDTGNLSVNYYEHRFPLDPREYPRVFAERLTDLEKRLPPEDADRQDFENLLMAFARLPPRDDTSERARAERYRDKEVCKRRLVRLCERSVVIREFVAATVARLNGEDGDPHDVDTLAGLLDAQAYRLAYWRVAVDEINYRRFFDVNHLAALRMNDPQVFEATHALLLELVERGVLDGLRIDHPDGLYDPEEYFERLQRPFRTAPPVSAVPLYVVAEKVLATHEHLSERWAVHGTTGYDFAAIAGAWLVYADAAKSFSRTYASFTGVTAGLATIEHDAKRGVMQNSLAAEVGVLATQLDRIAQLDRRTADFTRNALREAIIEVIANFPVYRTYVSSRGVHEDDRRHVNWAVNVARKHSQAGDLTVFDFLRDVLLLDAAQGRPAAHREAMLEFTMKFQQVTSPVMAKSVEDTAFYVYNRLVALNEVGGDPLRFGASTGALHAENSERHRRWPFAMLVSSTHDTKRSGDVRARIAALSEMPADWRHHLGRWSRLNRSRRGSLDERPVPSRNDEYLLYQTLLGLWPLADETDSALADLAPRLSDYMVKAAREAKIDTSWMNPNEAYEAGLGQFVAALLEHPDRNAFLRDFRALASRIAFFGLLNGLAQSTLRFTAPGVPDLYQGTELPDFSLVDPDNRRPVDYGARTAELAALESRARRDGLGGLARELVRTWRDGRIKLFLTWRCLTLRGERPRLVSDGGYEALRVSGSRADHVCAFRRAIDGEEIIVVVPRWLARLSGAEPAMPCGASIWEDTCIELPIGVSTAPFVDRFTGAAIAPSESQQMALAQLLADFPVALLTR